MGLRSSKQKVQEAPQQPPPPATSAEAPAAAEAATRDTAAAALPPTPLAEASLPREAAESPPGCVGSPEATHEEKRPAPSSEAFEEAPPEVGAEVQAELLPAAGGAPDPAAAPPAEGEADLEPGAGPSAVEASGVQEADQQPAGQQEATPTATCPVSESTKQLVSFVEAEDWEEANRALREAADCDPNARTSDWGYSLLRAAAEEGATETCGLLLERKADPNAKDQNGMTPLMGSIVGGDTEKVVSMLLAARADPEAVTDDGFTALKWATRLNREAAIATLRAAGMTGEATCF